MEDKVQQQQHDSNSPKHITEKSDQPVRSRWTPKPEQILILESIFNSGMVNPPKDETIRIRKLLEKFGAVGDANVFYWFQNRRSRSRRRQRQLQQASLEQRNQMMVQVQQPQQQQQVNNVVGGGAIPFDHHQQLQINPTMGFVGSSSPSFTDSSGSSSSSSCGGGGVLGCQQGMDGFFSVSSQMGFPGIDQTLAASSLLSPPNLNYQSGN